MGLSSFPSAAEGMVPVIVMNTIISVALLKNMVRSVLQVVMGANWIPPDDNYDQLQENARERRISITQFKSLCSKTSSSGTAKKNETSSSSRGTVECCCVCLCNFEAEEEVSELSCKHFFHRGCLDKWFDNKHTTCPLCRSIL